MGWITDYFKACWKQGEENADKIKDKREEKKRDRTQRRKK